MAALDDAITALGTKVSALTSVVASTKELLKGLRDQLAAAIEAAKNAGATAAQLQSLTDLTATLGAQEDDLAAAVAQGTGGSITPEP